MRFDVPKQKDARIAFFMDQAARAEREGNAVMADRYLALAIAAEEDSV